MTRSPDKPPCRRGRSSHQTSMNDPRCAHWRSGSSRCRARLLLRRPQGASAPSQRSTGSEGKRGERRQPEAIRGYPQLAASPVGLSVEAAVRTVIAGNGAEEVVLPVLVGELGGLLRLVARPREIAVAESRHELVADDRRNGRSSDIELAPPVPGRPHD